MEKNVTGEEHRDYETSYNNLRGVYRTLKQSNEPKEYHEKALISRKRSVPGRSIAMSQKAIATWNVFIKLLDNTLRQRNTTKRD